MPMAVPVTVVLSAARHPPGLMVRTMCIARACALASGLPIASTGIPADSGPAITASAKAGITNRIAFIIIVPPQEPVLRTDHESDMLTGCIDGAAHVRRTLARSRLTLIGSGANRP
jgi:hypothetical protein